MLEDSRATLSLSAGGLCREERANEGVDRRLLNGEVVCLLPRGVPSRRGRMSLRAVVLAALSSQSTLALRSQPTLRGVLVGCLHPHGVESVYTTLLLRCVLARWPEQTASVYSCLQSNGCRGSMPLLEAVLASSKPT
eukprot:214431-Rhodomonas_salina.1